MTAALDPAAVERFRCDCLALLDAAPTPDEPLGLAVSGGPDSMAMLALAAVAFPGAVSAATIDHRLRSESAAEAALVARWCAAHRIPHATLAADVAITGSGIQAQARDLRYRLLGQWARRQHMCAVATAHHLDDQAETFLMRAVRGSGIAGLRGIPARSTVAGLAVVRPLLGWRRAELLALVQAAGLPHADDPSNADPSYERVRVRQALAGAAWLDPVGLAASARHLADIDAQLAAMHELLWRERVASAAGEITIDIAGLPRELRRRLALSAITQVLGAAPANANVEALLDQLEARKSATHAEVIVRSKGTRWHFAKAPPRRSG